MCHGFINDSRFYQFLFRVDEQIAAEVRAGGCSCGGVLHSARYPRKPRGARGVLDESYTSRLSFCCAEEGCRRRTTPPSVRFLGRKVYLSVIVVLVTALEQGLTPRRRAILIEPLDLWPQTIGRWRRWWRETFVASRTWRAERGKFMPPVKAAALPGALLGRLNGDDLRQRLSRLLGLIAPITSALCTGYLRVDPDPQKM
ncbi:hypothetical protein BMS3Bbin13_00775 [bacterium BMS3Bbin13]|nr:hypothetical protein BMS3Bbin13_00775 [bacterium BMS3Bbin13]